MPEHKRVPAARLRPDSQQPRRRKDEADLLSLGDNMKRFGQQIPLITCEDLILDGERRWLAAQLVGILELDIVELPKRLPATELRLVQMSLDVHRASLSAMERSDFLARIKSENNWSVTELAENSA